MDFSARASLIVAESVIFFRRVLSLVFSPYTTMRSISFRMGITEYVLLYGAIAVYYMGSHRIRTVSSSPYTQVGMVGINVAISILFFFTALGHQKGGFPIGYIRTWSYSLIPTLIWFYTSAALFKLVPPPRSLSLYGQGLSILYAAFTVSLVIWKIILVYYSIRFSSGAHLLRILRWMVVYALLLFPYSILLYFFGMFRVPFL